MAPPIWRASLVCLVLLVHLVLFVHLVLLVRPMCLMSLVRPTGEPQNPLLGTNVGTTCGDPVPAAPQPVDELQACDYYI